MTDDRFDPYAVLGVSRGAEAQEISAAFRAQARRHHPDVARGQDAHHRMANLNRAWSILRDPARRAAWDEAHGFTAVTSHALSRPHVTTTRVDPAPTASGWRRGPDGEGAAGPPPGRPSGTVLTFGRHIGWSLGEIARVDAGYLRWLVGRPEGARHIAEIEALLGPGTARDGWRGERGTPGGRDGSGGSPFRRR